MSDILNDHHTICAMATASGGAMGVIRVSGDNAIAIVDKTFVPASKQSLQDAKAQSVLYGYIQAEDRTVIDEVLVSVFRAPHSYTGEDTVEISCHGSAYIIKEVLERLIRLGCRQALPGEFTQRAFLNGKMDLSQAEAVADLISSTNKATHQLALGQLRGHFSDELRALRDKLLKITSLIELELDFSDQDVTFANREELQQLAQHIKEKITRLAQSFQTGRALKSGVSVAIVGKTNVGKSTLLNRLLKEERAIVSEIHGTTRDVIEDTMQIRGVTFRFIDTAGIRETNDKIESLGIERTYRKLSEAAIVIWMIDASPTFSEIQEMEARVKGKKLIVVANKMDEKEVVLADYPWTIQPAFLAVSAKYNRNIDLLEATIYHAADIPEIHENDVIVTNARHYEALLHAQESIGRVIEGIVTGLSGDLLSEDLRQCIHQLSEITGGTITTSDVLNSIFKDFCIGK
ncbi:tRNA uridine-5-carboxymethylaminomethyl(34) synthesis GTPase MnmE [Hoylesella marshii]|uniref:tRNA modification GTPase MnmE n=1 Tax=Hoylesella marshii DSM 16973 = JCM 13450 TaxID=862515 RepID=E0NSL8_9BACT|nr:tRNA uridine-5-carboxymethylaminomethyl(34) synthesis GTPase MnmE [Hoylesella marshii]EFM01885.1 tRNA modification GTPase TrmE [Hoylesella marshii DSM 16973 = JCM 13450]